MVRQPKKSGRRITWGLILGVLLTANGCVSLGTPAKGPGQGLEGVSSASGGMVETPSTPAEIPKDDRIEPEPAVVEDVRKVPAPQDEGVSPSREPQALAEPDAWRKKSEKETLDLYIPPKDSADISPKNDGLILNFDQAELHEVVRAIADMLGINYLVDQPLTGRVTIQTAEKIPSSELFEVFVQILEANNLTMLKNGELYRIVPAKNASRLPLSARMGRGRLKGEPERGFMIQVIPLKYVSPQEMTKLIAPFASETGSIVSHEGSRTLVVVDTWNSIQRILRLVSVFDIDVFQNMHYKFYPLKSAEAEETAKILDKVYALEGAKGATLQFMPITRINTILALGQNPEHFRLVDTLVEELDQDLGRTEPRIYVYSVKNGEASELGDLLTNVFSKNDKEEDTVPTRAGESSKEKTDDNSQKTVMFPGDKTAKKTQQVAAGEISSISGASTLKGEIRITPDTIRNVLIIEATPSDYQIVESILKRIDVMPRQVLIEVVIADIRLDDSSDLGVEWEFDSESDSGNGVITANVGEAGLTYNIGLSDTLGAELSAFVQNKTVNIISSPKLMASDNKEAKINISTEVPVVNSEYRYDDDSSDVLETNIQYRDTGVILSVTPHINERGLVSMEISQEVSDSAGSMTVAGKSYPSFSSRTVSTTLTVKNGQTIVIGGMMSDSDEESDLGVPILSSIPFFGFLFGSNSKTKTKTELIILIRPKVIVDLDDVDSVTRDFSNRVSEIFPQSSTGTGVEHVRMTSDGRP